MSQRSLALAALLAVLGGGLLHLVGMPEAGNALWAVWSG